LPSECGLAKTQFLAFGRKYVYAIPAKPEPKIREEARFLRRFRLAIADDLTDDRTNNAKMFRHEVNVLPLQGEESLRLKPVPTAINTIVRSLIDSADSRSVSLDCEHVGILRRLALWRTSVIGFRSKRSYLHAWLNRTLKMLRIFAELDLASDKFRSHVFYFDRFDVR